MWSVFELFVNSFYSSIEENKDDQMSVDPAPLSRVVGIHFSSEQLVYSVIETINISELCYYLICMVNINSDRSSS